ncbi:hypothetical protein SUGI_1222690 [Cryptomeria japonica]|uniref:Uncharacterized protein n=1 Tax=Cryptomeria japonica TaxID=3369 RepID=A0AAD3NNS2_CRYJA|nr:hypothetical protein SUGI_1222690 [Cryptomeria japonica]
MARRGTHGCKQTAPVPYPTWMEGPNLLTYLPSIPRHTYIHHWRTYWPTSSGPTTTDTGPTTPHYRVGHRPTKAVRGEQMWDRDLLDPENDKIKMKKLTNTCLLVPEPRGGDASKAIDAWAEGRNHNSSLTPSLTCVADEVEPGRSGQ